MKTNIQVMCLKERMQSTLQMRMKSFPVRPHLILLENFSNNYSTQIIE